MILQEPLTVLTDYLLSALAFFFFVRLTGRFRANASRFELLWGLMFFMISAGAAFGGTAHGFKGYFPQTVQAAVWKGAVFSIGLASFFMLAAYFERVFQGGVRSLLTAAAVLKLAVYLIVMTFQDRFVFVIADYLFSMAAVLVLSMVSLKGGDRGALYIVLGITVSFAAAGVQMSSLFLGPLNHNDLYHVLQMAACLLLYKAAFFKAATRP